MADRTPRSIAPIEIAGDRRGHAPARFPLLYVLSGMMASIAVAAYGTWPLAVQLGSHVYDPAQGHGSFAWTVNPDIRLQIWVLAWDVHALLTAPASLFDANIFYPAPLTLATHDHMLGALPIYLPLAAVSGNPVFAHQATLLLTFACCFLAALTVVYAWTGSLPAGLLAASLFAFSPFRGTHLGWLNLEGSYYLALVPLLAWYAVRDRRRRWPVLLAAVLFVQAMHSYYLGYAAFLGVGVIGATAVALDLGARRHWARLVLPVGIAGLLVALSLIPYALASRFGTIEPPTLDMVRRSSAQFGNTGVTPLGLGLALGGVAFWGAGLRPTVSRAWPLGLLLVAVVGHVLALGPEVGIGRWTIAGPFAWLAHVLPGLYAFRVPQRFNAIVTMALAVLAGVGTAGATGWVKRRVDESRPWVSTALDVIPIALAMWTAARFMGGQPIALQAVETAATVPPVYRWLADQPRGAVLELPFRNFSVFSLDRNTESLRVYRSIYHWQPIVNGYSGYAPSTYPLIDAMSFQLPRQSAVEEFARMGIRYVIVDEPSVSASDRDAWRRAAVPRREFGRQVVYVLRSARDRPATLLGRFLTGEEARTPGGIPLDTLPAAAQRARFVGHAVPGVVPAGFPLEGTMTIVNGGERAWPGIALPGRGGVALTYRVLDHGGRQVPGAATRTPLGVDVRPGEQVTVPFWFTAPRMPGQYSLDVYAVQDGAGRLDSPDGGLAVPITVVKWGDR